MKLFRIATAILRTALFCGAGSLAAQPEGEAETGLISPKTSFLVTPAELSRLGLTDDEIEL